MQLVDSHCHIDFPEFADDLDAVQARMQESEVVAALCVAVNLEDLPGVLALANSAPNLFASVGVHPGYSDVAEPSENDLIALTANPKVIAIGETGLDFYRESNQATVDRQCARFRRHIRAAAVSKKPLIVHTRAASPRTLELMREEGATGVGGIMHCFTEDLETARACLDLGFHVSFSGIVSFRSAESIREVAAYVPDDRILIETDSPYLAPVPHRGKRNEPAFVRDVAAAIAQVRGCAIEKIADITTGNFLRLFPQTASAISGQ